MTSDWDTDQTAAPVEDTIDAMDGTEAEREEAEAPGGVLADITIDAAIEGEEPAGSVRQERVVVSQCIHGSCNPREGRCPLNPASPQLR